MSGRSILAASLVVAAGAAVWLAWSNLRHTQASESAQAALVARRTELERQVRGQETALKALRARLANDAPAAPKPTPSIANTPADPAKPQAANSRSEWLEDPKVQVLFLASERARFLQNYRPFFQARGLSQTEGEKLGDAFAAQRAMILDLNEISRRQNIPVGDPALRAQNEQVTREFEAVARQVLGSEGYEQFLDYRWSLPVRTFVGRVAGAALLDGIPLERAQGDRLLQLLAGAVRGPVAGREADMSKIDWKAAEVQARDFLSPEQIKLLRLDTPAVGGVSPATRDLLRAVDRASQAMASGKQ